MASKSASLLDQDPHRVREDAVPTLPAAIGRELHRIRRQQG
ncbi:MAG: MerR family transcriptional regulator, partial [Alphaproteobacteria bacterium]